jgi:SAM-dependent MidA family methyltransferase
VTAGSGGDHTHRAKIAKYLLMADLNQLNAIRKRQAEHRQRMENLLQLTLPNTMGTRFRVLEG